MNLFDRENQWRFSSIAQRKKTGPLEGEDQSIAELMDLHPELDPFWELGEGSASPQEVDGVIVNPFVHLMFHLQVQNQIEKEYPPEVKMAFLRLVEQGLSDHDALHAIISVFADIAFRATRRAQTFDETEYVSSLSRLTVG
ncbi:MAG: DUF1841 family protein [Leptospirillum sp.]|jgi:hypothetical protein|nr:DUF1841 family protein [Nitrospiraceae bacterium]